MNAELENAVRRIDLITVPGWATLSWLVHGLSTRAGGGTTVYRRDQARGELFGERAGAPAGELGGELAGELNLGFTSDDSRAVVTRNRELLLAKLLGARLLGGDHASGPEAPRLVTLRQTHSANVLRVDRSHVHSCASPAVLEGDGLMTDVPGILLGILTADCVPVLVVDTHRRIVAAFHAGWRGTVQQIVEKGIARMGQEFGSAPEELQAAVGPAIGACCYAVGEEVRQQFADRFTYADSLFSEAAATEGPAATHLDLAEANRRQLLAAGLDAESIHMTQVCTSCQTDRFFSHRAEHGKTGRLMAVVGMP
jgi:YfiH family protein